MRRTSRADFRAHVVESDELASGYGIETLCYGGSLVPSNLQREREEYGGLCIVPQKMENSLFLCLSRATKSGMIRSAQAQRPLVLNSTPPTLWLWNRIGLRDGERVLLWQKDSSQHAEL